MKRCWKIVVGAKLAFGLSEITLLNTGTESLVELVVKDSRRGGRRLVVGKDVLLQGLTAARGQCKYGHGGNASA